MLLSKTLLPIPLSPIIAIFSPLFIVKEMQRIIVYLFTKIFLQQTT